MGQRGHQDWSKERLPVGTVRIRTRQRGQLQVRMIKIRDGGPRSRQWVNFARWWWEHNRGPIPPGKRVAHRDGDSLNDDPANLVLCSPGDVVYLWHDRDPKGSAANYRKLRPATAKHNRLRARVRRAVAWLPTRWYAVDTQRRIVVNDPRRVKGAVLAAHFETVRRPKNGCGYEAALCGWNSVPSASALVLSVLARGERTRDELLSAVNALRRDLRICRHRLGLQGLYQALQPLKAAEWITIAGRGAQAVYAIRAEALRFRVPGPPIVAVRGDELDGEEFAGYRKMWPDQYRRLVAGERPANDERRTA